MAQEKENTSETAAKPATKTAERTFPIDTLRNKCMKLFGCTSSTFDGAFFGVKEKEYSVNDAKKIITEWLKKEAK